MQREEDFDSFYRDTRRPVLLQAFALTGDLQAARVAVRDAYVAAWHHWRKVAPLDDRLSWVRPHAWHLAQRRHAGRIWHRNKGLTDEQKQVLDGLGKLSTAQRRALLLNDLGEVPPVQAARELGLTRDVAERNLRAARAELTEHLEVDPERLPVALRALDPALDSVTIPRASIVRRAGRKRRQVHTLAAAVVSTALAITTGAVAYEPVSSAPGTEQVLRPGVDSTDAEDAGVAGPALPTADDLLDEDQIRRLGGSRPWRVTGTHDNTSGDGLNTVCQQSRYADPDGLAAVVREFEAGRPSGKEHAPERSALQTVEVSRSVDQAKQAFDTTVGWYAGCQAARLQILQAYDVSGVGDNATVLMLRVWERPVTTYSVAVARTGRVVTSTVGRTVGGEPPALKQVTQSLADSVSMLCASSGSTGCAQTPEREVVPPPPSGETPGMLAVADLPPVGQIDEAWVGTPYPARPNPSQTTCDRARFVARGAKQTKARTFLIPEAKVAARFGLSETYGIFGNATKARRFIDGVRTKLDRCEDRDLATTVHDRRHGRVARTGATWLAWDHSTEVTDDETVRFRVGFVRVGKRVAQVTFVTAPRGDMGPQRFDDLLVRAGDRLLELS